MIDWFRSLFASTPSEPPETPDIDAFVARQRESRADAIGQRRASERITRQLRSSTAATIVGMATDVQRTWARQGERGDVG